MLKCPLCLQTLDETQRVVVHCLAHGKTRDLSGGASLAAELPKCPSRGCSLHRHWRGDSAVVKHVGCSATFDFAELATLANEPTFDRAGTTIPIEHWEMTMLLRLIAPGGPEARPEPAPGAPVGAAPSGTMWYPVELLLSCRESVTGPFETGGRASVVELCGSKKSGKTVLALQAMDQEGYSPHGHPRPRALGVRDYAYVEPAGSLPASSMFEILALRGQMEQNLGWLPPDPTEETTINLKAVRLAPGQPKTRAAQRMTSNDDLSGGSLAKGFWRLIATVLRELSGLGSAATAHNILFYDTPGEASSAADSPYLMNLDRAADVVAVVLDGASLWGTAVAAPHAAPVSSPLFAARQRVERAAETRSGGRHGLRCCLVVTKLDLFDQGTAENQALAERDDQEATNLRTDALARALQAMVFKDPNAQPLLDLLGCVDDVFFVWTKRAHLATLAGVDPPRTHGMAPFVSWCLSKKIVDVFGA